MNIFAFFKNISPEPLKALARKVRQVAYVFSDSYRPYLNKISYLGFKIYYTHGAGLVQRIRFGNTQKVYEHKLVNAIASMLKKYPHPVFMDIGTNIGLITIGVISKLKEVKVYAFEPSPIAYRSFFTTIFANRLNDKIKLLNLAVSNQNGEVSFTTHGDYASCGDGIRDTGRSDNDVASIKIGSTTLDSWWSEHNKPQVHVIKLDIEGAELWALQGAENFIKETRPVIYLEISKINLKSYPYKEGDLFDFFAKNNYDLFTLSGKKCTRDSLPLITETEDTFKAEPII